MDPTDPDSDQEAAAAEAAAMAEMMGFTSFGSQAPRPSKKRRYNPRADAVADETSGTGANTLPIMPRSVRAEGSAGGRRDGGESERGRDPVLGGGGGGDGQSGKDGKDAAAAGVGVGGGERDGKDEDDDPAPRYIDTSRSPLRTGEDETASFLPVIGAGFSEHRPAGQGGRGGGGGGGGKRIWWTDYYDPSSNENPWEWLEKARGLEAVGSWLPRGHGANRVGGGRSG
jgi:hypothetical protein